MDIDAIHSYQNNNRQGAEISLQLSAFSVILISIGN